MQKHLKLICLLLTLALYISCTGEKGPKSGMQPPLPAELPEVDSLKFSSGVRAVFQDSKGNYWFGSHSEGACRYDGKSFAYFAMEEGLPDNQVRSIQEDEDGNIWFGTANGVSSYDGERMVNHPAKTFEGNWEGKDAEGYLWFNAGKRAGVNFFDGEQLNYLPLPLPDKPKFNGSYGVTGISKGKDGKVWIATYAALFYFDGHAIQVVEESKLVAGGRGELHIRSVFADSKGRIWIGNNGIGVLLYDGESAIHFSEEQGLVHRNSPLSGSPSPAGTLEHVFSIQEDGQGNIWFGDRDTGPWKYDGESMANYAIDRLLDGPMIWTIARDRSERLLLGMAGGGVYAFDGESFQRKF